MLRKGFGNRYLMHAMAAAALTIAQPGFAQTQAQFDRLDALARYGMALGWCDKLGMKLVPDWGRQIEQRMKAEAASFGLKPELAKQVTGEAVNRQARIAQIDIRAIAEEDTKTEAGLRNVRSHFLKYGNVCLNAARDPLYSTIITVPANFELGLAATEAADSLLRDGGLASWQTPTIQARGDLMMAAGACRRHIGAAASDAIYEAYSHASDPRERTYYVKSFDDGLSDTSLNLDATQCKRLIIRMKAKAGWNNRR